MELIASIDSSCFFLLQDISSKESCWKRNITLIDLTYSGIEKEKEKGFGIFSWILGSKYWFVEKNFNRLLLYFVLKRHGNVLRSSRSRAIDKRRSHFVFR